MKLVTLAAVGAVLMMAAAPAATAGPAVKAGTSAAGEARVASGQATDFSAAKRKRRVHRSGGNAAAIRSFMGVAGMIVGIAAAERARRHHYVYDGGYVGEPYVEYTPAYSYEPAYEYAPDYGYAPAYQYAPAPYYRAPIVRHRLPHVHVHRHVRHVGGHHIPRIGGGGHIPRVGGGIPHIRGVVSGGGRRHR